MDNQSNQGHSIFENKGDAFRRVVKPNLAAMQLQLLPSVRIEHALFSWIANSSKITILGTTMTVELVAQPAGHTARSTVTVIAQRSREDVHTFSRMETAKDMPPRPGLHQRYL
jgi:hypothetical protein